MKNPIASCLGLPFIEAKDALPKGGIIVMRRFLLLPIIFLFFALTGWLYFGINLKTIPDAFATGGAFPSTKHGGGTVDGIKFTGINRATGGDVASYFGDNPEAGDYQPGECAHCHEPHASFGGNEPPPNSILYNSEMSSTEAAGPDPYLLFGAFDSGAAQGTYSKLCWYCHEKMSLGIPPNPPGYGYWGFYQGKTKYQASSHSTSINFKYPGIQTGDTAAGTEPWPRRSRTGLSTGNIGSCLNCHTPHGISGSANYPNDAVAPNTTNPSYGVSSTATGLIPRQLIAWEEALCLRCHDSDGTTGAGTAPNIKIQIDNRVTDTIPASSLASGHAVRKYFNLHNLANESTAAKRVSGWNASPNWHVECTDCHNPHLVSKGPREAAKTYVFQASGKLATYNTNRTSAGVDTTSGPILIANANKGMWGVSMTNAAGAYNVTPTVIEPVTYMYELCLKCHSTFGFGASPPNAPSTTRLATPNNGTPLNAPFTDVSKEFDSDNCGANGAIHPVFAQGCNQPVNTAYTVGWTGAGRRDGTGNPTITGGLSNIFVPPWDKQSYITCVDCHADSVGSSTPRGPHGSSQQFILRKLDTSITYDYCTVASPGCTPATVDYNTYTDGGTKVLKTEDPNNFCLNCHRADVYGFQGQGVYPPYNALSRLKHPVDGAPSGSGGAGQSFKGASTPPRGIVCMRCHGGRIIGGIHGINTTNALGQLPAEGAPWGTDAGLRFLYGETWRGYTKATTVVNGTCFRTKSTLYNGVEFNTCGQHADSSAAGASTGLANYDY